MTTKVLRATSGAGVDYTTLAAWATYVNALTFSADEILEVDSSAGAIADSATIAIGGYTPGAFSLIMRAVTGHGLSSANALRWNSASAALSSTSGSGSGAYQFTGSKLTVDGLQFKCGSATNVVRTATGTNQVIKNCVIQSSAGTNALFVSSNNPSLDNLAIVVNSTGVGVILEGSNATVTGCTVAKSGTASGTGINKTYGGAPVVKNTAVIGFTTDFAGTFSASSTNNATDKGTFGGTNAGASGQVSITSADFGSLTASSEDLRVASGSTKLIDTGATAGLSTDIFGVARGATYDIGATEYAGGGGGSTYAPPPRRGGASFKNLFSM